ncbi:hypothetical protein [Medusavirus stheno T3]|uniref:Uncharacterized protein n=1 Tax=Medusavirus stheno T3 TaxID=3069717 RepID=A0A7S7YEH9_9VIRU|nr:hypothetical protein QKU73_gp125 [Acanthamoeba castellanii medusavirus]QPB44306.1 hypothetical protein [Medusavirus stheno T3]
MSQTTTTNKQTLRERIAERARVLQQLSEPVDHVMELDRWNQYVSDVQLEKAGRTSTTHRWDLSECASFPDIKNDA